MAVCARRHCPDVSDKNTPPTTTRAARVCSRLGCINLVYGRGSLCNDHARQARAKRDARNRRPNTRQAYGPQWPRVSREFLEAHPECVICGKRSSHADHIIPVARGGAVLDWSNLQSLCRSHHSRKTAALDGGFGNPKK